MSGNIFNLDTNESEGKFYVKRNVKFADKTVDIKNKSVIRVVDGFIAPYRCKYKNESGIYTYVSGETFYIRDFTILEEGIDEKQKPFNFSQKKSNQFEAKKVSGSDKLNSFSYNEYSDVTPF
jgi:hypothetical protein